MEVEGSPEQLLNDLRLIDFLGNSSKVQNLYQTLFQETYEQSHQLQIKNMIILGWRYRYIPYFYCQRAMTLLNRLGQTYHVDFNDSLLLSIQHHLAFVKQDPYVVWAGYSTFLIIFSAFLWLGLT